MVPDQFVRVNFPEDTGADLNIISRELFTSVVLGIVAFNLMAMQLNMLLILVVIPLDNNKTDLKEQAWKITS